MNPLRSNNTVGGVPIPSTPEEMLRVFPQLVSALVQLQNRINQLEIRLKSVETIGGNGNQL